MLKKILLSAIVPGIVFASTPDTTHEDYSSGNTTPRNQMIDKNYKPDNDGAPRGKGK